MSGLLTDGMALGSTFSGLERAPFDTQNAAGANPQVEAVSIAKLATLALYYGSSKDKTTVAGTRYITSTNVGMDNVVLTGIAVDIGSVGGTDSWIVELHNPAGVLVATSATAGTTAGTAASWQQIPFTTPYTALAGTYYAVLQSNGTTAKPLTYNSPTSPHLTGSATGVFGTGASITPPTTYTANLGPIVQLY